MNKIYCTIINFKEGRRVLAVASERARKSGGGCRQSAQPRALQWPAVRALLASVALAWTSTVWALPSGGEVVHGQASMVSSGPVMRINQTSQNATINWHNFSVAAGEQVLFSAPNVQSITLNRVSGQTDIQGLVQSNASLWFSNPNGVFSVSNGGSIKAAGEVFITGRDVAIGNYSRPVGVNTGTVLLDGTSALAARQIVLDMASVRMPGAKLTAEDKVIVQARDQIEAQGATMTAADQVVIGRDDWKTGALAQAVDLTGARLQARQVETSGRYLRADGLDLRGSGEWLLDPTDLTISATSSTGGSLALAAAQSGASNVSTTDLQAAINAGTSVTLAASGSITQQAALTFDVSGANGTPTLTLDNTSGSKQTIQLIAITDNSSGAGSRVSLRALSAGGAIRVGDAIRLKGSLTLDNTYGGTDGAGGTPSSGFISTDKVKTQDTTLATSETLAFNHPISTGTGITLRYATYNGSNTVAVDLSPERRSAVLVNGATGFGPGGSLVADTGDIVLDVRSGGTDFAEPGAHAVALVGGQVKASAGNVSITARQADSNRGYWSVYHTAGTIAGQKVLIDTINTNELGIGFYSNALIEVLSGGVFDSASPDAVRISATVKKLDNHGIFIGSLGKVRNQVNAGGLSFISSGFIDNAGEISINANTYGQTQNILFDTTSGDFRSFIRPRALSISAGTSTSAINYTAKSSGSQIILGNDISVPGFILVDNSNGGQTAASSSVASTGVSHAALSSGSLASGMGVQIKGISQATLSISGTGAITSATGVDVRGSGSSTTNGAVSESGAITNTGGATTGVWASSTYNLSLGDITNSGAQGIRLTGGFGRAAGSTALTHGTITALGTLSNSGGVIGLSMAQPVSPYTVEGKAGVTAGNASTDVNVAYSVQGGSFTTSSMKDYASGNFINYRIDPTYGTPTVSLLNNYSATYGTAYDSASALAWLRDPNNSSVTLSGAGFGVTATVVQSGLKWSGNIGGTAQSNNTQTATSLATGAVLDASNNSLTIGGTARTYTINPATLTITGDTTSLNYNGSARTNTYTLSPLAYSDTAQSIGLVVSGQATGTQVGTYNDNLSATGTSGNYSFRYVNGSLTINKAPLTVTGATDPVTYDGISQNNTFGRQSFGQLPDKGRAIRVAMNALLPTLEPFHKIVGEVRLIEGIGSGVSSMTLTQAGTTATLLIKSGNNMSLATSRTESAQALPVFKPLPGKPNTEVVLDVVDQGSNLSATPVEKGRYSMSVTTALESAARAGTAGVVEASLAIDGNKPVPLKLNLTEEGVLVARMPLQVAEVNDEKVLALLAIAAARDPLGVKVSQLRGVLILSD